MNDAPSAERSWHWSSGACKLAVGGLLAWLVFRLDAPELLDTWWQANVGPQVPLRRAGHTLLLAALGLPVVLAIIGLLELLLRRPFRRIAASWDALSEWVQGLLVLVLTIGSFALLMWYVNQFLAPP